MDLCGNQERSATYRERDVILVFISAVNALEEFWGYN